MAMMGRAMVSEAIDGHVAACRSWKRSGALTRTLTPNLPQLEAKQCVRECRAARGRQARSEEVKGASWGTAEAGTLPMLHVDARDRHVGPVPRHALRLVAGARALARRGRRKVGSGAPVVPPFAFVEHERRYLQCDGTVTVL